MGWQRAFDKTPPSALISALRRFGLPTEFIAAITDIYTDRTFEVKDCGVTSGPACQQTGIFQGCPLSPFLFVIVMTVVMHEAVASLSTAAKQARGRGALADILYADDTLLLGVSSDLLGEFLSAVQKAGGDYGLTLHQGKFQLLKVRTTSALHNPDGGEIESAASMTYLGSLVHDDGKAVLEITRRIGMCKSLFQKLSRFWAHASIGLQRKLEVFQSLVVSKLMYGLAGLWLGIAEQRRVDAFQNYCLRRLLRIPAACISRVRNEEVLRRASQGQLSRLVLRNQLKLFGEVARLPSSDPLRAATFQGDGLTPITTAFVRKVGRPRHTWTEQLLHEAARLCGGVSKVSAAILDKSRWDTLLLSFSL